MMGSATAPKTTETEIMTTKETAAYVRLGKPTLEHYRIRGGGPPFLKLGSAIRYRKCDVDEWLASRVTNYQEKK